MEYNMDNRIFTYYLGEILLGALYYDRGIYYNTWKIIPNRDSAVRELLAGNSYISQQDAENAIKAQVCEECRSFITKVVKGGKA